MPCISLGLDECLFCCDGIDVVLVCCGLNLHASTILHSVGGQFVVEVQFWLFGKGIKEIG